MLTLLLPANQLSLARIVVIPVIVGLLAWDTPASRLAAAVLFALAALSDLLDGYIARRFNQVSTLGVFLDLTADKLLVVCVLLALVPKLVPAWIAMVIVGRELIISGLRAYAAAVGEVIPAGTLGKLKTVVTTVGITWVIVDTTTSLLPWGTIILLLATLLTIVSGLDYLWRAAWLLDRDTRLPARPTSLPSKKALLVKTPASRHEPK